MNIKHKNLAFSLPDEVLAKVWEYDSTYKSFFSEPDFKSNLHKGYLKKKSVREQCISDVKTYMKSYFENELFWYNEYACINNQYCKRIKKLQSIDDFFVNIYQIDTILYYKVIPNGLTEIPKPKYFDGYFMYPGDIEDGRLLYMGAVSEDTEVLPCIPNHSIMCDHYMMYNL